MNRRNILKGLLALVPLPVIAHASSPLSKHLFPEALPGDLIEVMRYEKGLSECGQRITNYIVQDDGSLKLYTDFSKPKWWLRK